MSPGGQINSDLRATDVESCIDFKHCWLYNYFERKQMKRKSHIKWNSREGQRWLQWGSKGNTRVKMVPNTASFLGSRNSCGNNLYPRERQRDQSCRGTLPPQHSRVRVYSSCHLLVIHEHCIGVGGGSQRNMKDRACSTRSQTSRISWTALCDILYCIFVHEQFIYPLWAFVSSFFPPLWFQKNVQFFQFLNKTVTTVSRINHCVTQGSPMLCMHIRHIAAYKAIHLIIVSLCRWTNWGWRQSSNPAFPISRTYTLVSHSSYHCFTAKDFTCNMKPWVTAGCSFLCVVCQTVNNWNEPATCSQAPKGSNIHTVLFWSHYALILRNKELMVAFQTPGPNRAVRRHVKSPNKSEMSVFTSRKWLKL